MVWHGGGSSTIDSLCITDFDDNLGPTFPLFWRPQNSCVQMYPQNPSNIKNVAVIFLLCQVKALWILEFSWSFLFIWQNLHFSENPSCSVYKGWAQSAYFCEMLPVPCAIKARLFKMRGDKGGWGWEGWLGGGGVGLLSPKLYADVPARPRKSDFLYTNFFA